MNKLFSGIKGREFNIKINPEGKVLAVEGMKEMFESMFDSLGLGAEHKEEMMKQLDKQFGDDKIRSQFERILYIFPDKEVKLVTAGQNPAAKEQEA